MYPDTDTPPTEIAQDRVARIRAQLPEAPWLRRAKLLDAGVSAELAAGLIASPFYGLYNRIQEDGLLPPNRVARVFVMEVRAIKRKGGAPEKISELAWRRLFDHLRAGELHWEAVPALIRLRARRPGAEWMAIAHKQQMLPLPADEWQPLAESLAHMHGRSSDAGARVRWLMGQMQRPAGRVPGQQAAALFATTSVPGKNGVHSSPAPQAKSRKRT